VVLNDMIGRCRDEAARRQSERELLMNFSVLLTVKTMHFLYSQGGATGSRCDAMKKLRVLALMHPDLVPPPDAAAMSAEDRFKFKTEYDVCSTLQQLGHEVRALGVQDELHPIRDAVEEFKPDVAFNLLEEFQGNVLFDQNVVSLLELLRVPYTGCNPRGLIISREKPSRRSCSSTGIRVPAFHAFPMGLKVKRPRLGSLIVKSLTEHSSLGYRRPRCPR
jgi:D-alanine-D-alanine ligase